MPSRVKSSIISCSVGVLQVLQLRVVLAQNIFCKWRIKRSSADHDSGPSGIVHGWVLRPRMTWEPGVSLGVLSRVLYTCLSPFRTSRLKRAVLLMGPSWSKVALNLRRPVSWCSASTRMTIGSIPSFSSGCPKAWSESSRWEFHREVGPALHEVFLHFADSSLVVHGWLRNLGSWNL